MDSIVAAIVDEGKWLFVAMLLSSLVVTTASLARWRGLPSRAAVVRAMHLFYGCMIGTMALGHLLAVSVKLVQGNLGGSPWVLYPLGVVLAFPAWSLAVDAFRAPRDHEPSAARAIGLNAAVAIYLVALGLHNLPLAAPAALNIAYQLHTRRAVGWTIVTVAVAANLALFAGATVFMLSGQSFEQFRGIE
jgi:hypothetical protein